MVTVNETVNFLLLVYRFNKSLLLVSLGLTVLIKSIELAHPWVLSYIMDLLLAGKRSEILDFLIYYIGLAIVSALLIPLRQKMMSHLIEGVRKQQSLAWNEALLNKSHQQISKIHKAEVIEAFHRARDSLSAYSWNLIGNQLTNLIIIGIILTYILVMRIYWILPLSALSAVLIIVTYKIITHIITPKLEKLHQRNDEYKSHLVDLYDNSMVIKLSGFLTTAIIPFQTKINDHFKQMTDVSFWQIILVSTNSLVVWLTQGLLLLIAVYFFADDFAVSTGGILGAYFYSSLLIEKIKDFSHLVFETAEWQAAHQALARILADGKTSGVSNVDVSVLATEPRHLDITIQPFAITRGGIKLSLTEEISIKHGDKVGIVGASGSGKTLLMDMIAGYIHFDQPTVQLGGIDIRIITNEQKAKIFAVCEAEIKMLSGTLNQAVLGGLPFTEQAEFVLHKLSLSKYVPYLSERPFPKSGLSAGEKKRFELFKALSFHKPVVLLDAPRELLDEELAAAIWEFMLEQLSACTLICTGHELHLFEDFDLIIAIDNHKIVVRSRS